MIQDRPNSIDGAANAPSIVGERRIAMLWLNCGTIPTTLPTNLRGTVTPLFYLRQNSYPPTRVVQPVMGRAV